MRVLLDTHTLLWWIAEDARLSPRARDVMADGRNVLLVSAASGWEIAIKVGLGRIELPRPIAAFLSEQLRQNQMDVLPVQMSHALRVQELPPLHRDPFDRMLVAQSQLERLPILTADPSIARYDAEVVW
ncbi:MAG: type II toxin-antitoxin system VapC family toxin [Candidatus Bipolaricaulis sp.]|nr:type II toxin-antitoxin system VapC family toxin [Candidatus Bipolaricaulis sp.]